MFFLLLAEETVCVYVGVVMKVEGVNEREKDISHGAEREGDGIYTHHESRGENWGGWREDSGGGTNEGKLWLMYKNKDNTSFVYAKRNFRLFI